MSHDQIVETLILWERGDQVAQELIEQELRGIFNLMQIKELKTGLFTSELFPGEVAIYADPSLHWRSMRELRYMLEELETVETVIERREELRSYDRTRNYEED